MLLTSVSRNTDRKNVSNICVYFRLLHSFKDQFLLTQEPNFFESGETLIFTRQAIREVIELLEKPIRSFKYETDLANTVFCSKLTLGFVRVCYCNVDNGMTLLQSSDLE